MINHIASFCYNKLVDNCVKFNRNLFGRTLWKILWDAGGIFFKNRTVTTVMHGYKVNLNYGYTYPVFSRLYPSMNNPLLELVNQCKLLKNGPVNIIDVGAAIGDTALLVLANCPDMVGKIYCIEGDKVFFNLLKVNLKYFSQCELNFTILSDKNERIPELIKQHEGTASAQGENSVESYTLDSLMLDKNNPSIELLKIDVDGFDGRVLGGSVRLIEHFKPAIIFEWHPYLYKQTDNDPFYPFQVLSNSGYYTFIWFNKFGVFDFTMHGFDRAIIDSKRAHCFRIGKNADWYYDIIALYRNSAISTKALEDMNFTKARRSAY